jgi:chromosome partitioning protein
VTALSDRLQVMQTVVDLAREAFSLYHSHIYALDEAGRTLVLAAGAGQVGRQMVAQGWEIPLDRKQSLVARAARSRQGVIANDVRLEPDFLPNPLLPDTRAEMAVPILAGERVLGVLDVQSDVPGRFTQEDIAIQTTLAAQVAVALENARLFQQVQRQADQEALINSISQKIQSTTTVETALQVAIRELGRALGAQRTSVHLDVTRKAVTSDYIKPAAPGGAGRMWRRHKWRGRTGGNMNTPYRIAICHQKEGLKTTTAISLGACLAERGAQVLLVDLDPAANLTTGLGLAPTQQPRSAADLLLGNDVLENVVQVTDFPGLNLIPANADMVLVSRFLYLRPQYEYLLKKCFSQDGLEKYDFVIMDCPPSLGPLAVTALTAADLALIPTQCEYYSVQALDGLLGAIRATRAKTNPRLIYRLLVTMYDRRGSLHTRVLSVIQERLSEALLETMIGFDSKLRESQMFGVPVTVLAPNTRGALQYRSLASEISVYAEAQTLPQPA